MLPVLCGAKVSVPGCRVVQVVLGGVVHRREVHGCRAASRPGRGSRGHQRGAFVAGGGATLACGKQPCDVATHWLPGPDGRRANVSKSLSSPDSTARSAPSLSPSRGLAGAGCHGSRRARETVAGGGGAVAVW